MNPITLTYKNHINESVTFGVDGLWFVDTDLHDYKWNYTSNNGKISNFDRGIVEKKINVVIAGEDAQRSLDFMNSIVECADKDILAKTQGELHFQDYYMKCYLVQSSKHNYIRRKNYIEIELTVVSDNPAWIKETFKMFGDFNNEGKNLDFSYDFPYDFTSPNLVTELVNTSFSDTDFKLVIHGEVSKPSIYIAGNLYEVNHYIANGEYMTIDSKNKTIYLTRNNGEIVNCFNDRNREHYIFTKIPSGENAVTWSGDYGFDITLYEERSEPKWI